MQRRMIYGPAFLLLVGALLGACRDETRNGTRDETESGSVLIVYERSGGFVGADDRLSISGDGSARLEAREGGRNVSLSKDDFDKIETLVSDVDWEALAGDHPPPRDVTASDGYQYVLIHDGVTVTTETLGVPAELETLIGALDFVISGRSGG